MQRLKAGDTVSVILTEPAAASKEISNNYTISERGTLKLPVLPNEIQVAGLTREELAEKLAAACIRAGIYKKPVFSVKLSTPTICLFPRVIVGGEVKSGDVAIIFTDGQRLGRAVELAGGFTDNADTRRIKLLRGEVEQVVDLSVESKHNANNPLLMDGDMIVVPAKRGVRQKASGQKMRLRRGDPVNLRIMEPSSIGQDFDTRYTVSESGTVKVPFLEEAIPAAGFTHEELAARIVAAYRNAGIFEKVVISATIPRDSFRVPPVITIGGEVKDGGAQVPCRDGMRLFAAIVSAGGFSEMADRTRVKLLRANQESILDLSVREGTFAPDVSNNPLLAGDDLVMVPVAADRKIKENQHWAEVLQGWECTAMQCTDTFDASIDRLVRLATRLEEDAEYLRTYRCAPGRVVLVKAAESNGAEQPIEVFCMVAPDGALEVPKLNQRVSVVNLAIPEAENRIAAALKDAGACRNPIVRISVRHKDRRPFPFVIVSGETGATMATVPLRQGMRMRAAVMEAGGFTQHAAQARVKLFRRGKEEIWNLGRTRQVEPLLEPGDRMVVERE